MINIGTGPSNARTITDHVAVLQPHAWLMLGHCAGLSNSQNLGDEVSPRSLSNSLLDSLAARAEWQEIVRENV